MSALRLLALISLADKTPDLAAAAEMLNSQRPYLRACRRHHLPQTQVIEPPKADAGLSTVEVEPLDHSKAFPVDNKSRFRRY
jgi:hypothetical protein